MAAYEKNFSYTMTVRLTDGTIRKCNVAYSKGHAQSWYSTESKARKALKDQMDWTTRFGNEVLSWKVLDRNGTIEEG